MKPPALRLRPRGATRAPKTQLAKSEKITTPPSRHVHRYQVSLSLPLVADGWVVFPITSGCGLYLAHRVSALNLVLTRTGLFARPSLARADHFAPFAHQPLKQTSGYLASFAATALRRGLVASPERDHALSAIYASSTVHTLSTEASDLKVGGYHRPRSDSLSLRGPLAVKGLRSLWDSLRSPLTALPAACEWGKWKIGSRYVSAMVSDLIWAKFKY